MSLRVRPTADAARRHQTTVVTGDRADARPAVCVKAEVQPNFCSEAEMQRL